MPSRRSIDTRLDVFQYALISALIKSVRLQLPTDAFYYLRLLSRSPRGVNSYILSRLLIAAAEDSVSPFTMYAAAHAWTMRNSSTAWSTIEQLTYAVATLPNAYTTPSYSDVYAIGSLPKEGYPRPMAFVEQVLHHWQSTEDQRADWVDLFTRALHPAQLNDEPALRLYEIVGEWAKDRMSSALWIAAYLELLPAFGSIDQRGGYNWYLRLAFATATGIIPSDELQTVPPAMAEAAYSRADKHITKGRILIPSYAYDGRHCWAQGIVNDPRFAGDIPGIINMSAMAKRNGYVLDRSQQGVSPSHQAPNEYLKHPYLQFSL